MEERIFVTAADSKSNDYQRLFPERRQPYGNALNRLADILSEYFCLDGLFYEEVPHQEGAKKRYRTKFRVSIAPSLKELLNDIHD